MSFPALLDTCVLYPLHLCDTLLRLAEAETFRPLWSEDILVELERNLVEVANLADRQVRHRVNEMRRSFPDAVVTGHRDLESAMTCDPKDRHVLAAAVRADVEVLVTANLRDFPPASVEPYDLTVLHPDDFLLDQLDLYPERTPIAVTRQAAAKNRPPMTVGGLLDALARCGVPEFAAKTKQLL